MSREVGLELAQAIQERRRRNSIRSLADFSKLAWPIVEPNRPYHHNWHIDAISEHLEAVTFGKIQNLLINMPPRHMKSLLVSVFWPAWVWITFPEKRWIFSSYSQTLSKRDSVKCRRIIESHWYRTQCEIDWNLATDQNEKMRFDNDRTGYRIATSVGGSGTGEGGDLIVCDDPHKATDVYSKTMREAVIEWWDEEMSTRANDPKNFGRVVVMQRLHGADLSGHLLTQGGYEHLCLPCEYQGNKKPTGIGWRDPRTKLKELLWPARFGPVQVADAKKRLGSAAPGQLNQSPTDLEGGIIKRKNLKYWRVLPARFDQEILSVDCSFGDTKGSSFVTMGAWGKIGGEAYLKDQIKDRMDLPATIKALEGFVLKHPKALVKLVEKKANGQAVIDSLKKKISGLIAVEPEGSKESRLNAVAPNFESGNVYIPDPSLFAWVSDYVEELVNFPNAAFDDQVDQTSQALLRFFGGAVAAFTEEHVPKKSGIAGSKKQENQW